MRRQKRNEFWDLQLSLRHREIGLLNQFNSKKAEKLLNF